MTDWTKSADWVPWKNAAALLLWWKQDLIKIMRAALTLEMGGISPTDPGYLTTLDEIETSKTGVAYAQFRYKRAWARLTESDKITWSIPDRPKLPSETQTN